MALTLTIIEENGLTVSDNRVVVVASSSGPQGAAGVGVPTGGTTGQVLAKASGTDYDTEWVTGGGGGSGDVVGPASSVDGRAVLFDGTTGKLIKEATAAPVLEGDARLTDARTPSAHKTTHATGGTDALAPSDIGAVPTSRNVSAGTGLSGGGDLSADRTLSVSYGTSAGTAAEGNDARLTDARTPTSHAASHQDGGSDELALDASQTTTGQFDVARLGTGTPSAFTFLDGTGAWTSDVPVYIPVKNTSGSTIAKGAPVYATGTVGDTSTIEIAPADADDSAKMPAIGLTESELDPNEFGYVVVVGTLRGVDTDGLAINAPLYVSTTAGQLTITKPTGASELIQNIGRVIRANQNSGEILVLGPGRTIDVPNSISASLLLSGTVATARLGSGTADATTFLRGDGSWQSPPGGTVDVVSNVASGRILGRTSSGSGDSEELTDANVRTFLGLATVATSGSASDLTTGTLAAARGGPVLVQPSSYSSTQSYWLPGVQYSALNNTLALAANRLRYVPFLIRGGTFTVDQIHAEVTTAAAASNIRCGVYAADIDWQPTGAALIDETATSATTGSKAMTVSNVALGPGRYLACIISDGAVSVRSGFAVQTWGFDHDAGRVTSPSSAQIILNRRVDVTYPASLPNTGPAWTTADYTATPFSAAGDPVLLLRGTIA